MMSRNKKIVEKIINILLNILIFIFGIVLLISIYIGVQTKILKKDYNDFFGYSIFEVQTGSMAETINAGDWIIVKLTSKVKLNDIITYEFNGEYITHRVIEMYNETYITKGDANNAKDEPVKQGQILGKVVKILGNFGILRKVLFNPGVLIALIVTLFLFNLAFKNDISIFKKKITLYVKKIPFLKFNKYNEYKKENEFLNKLKTIIQKIFSIFKKKEESQIIEKAPQITEIERHEKLYDLSEFENDEEIEEDELEKTSLYRVISVDATEVDDTFLEIAENEMLTEKNENTIPKNIEKEEIETEEDDDLTDINLDLLNSKTRKKSKNIIDTLINIKKEELNEIADILIDDNLKLSNEATINSEFVNIYIDAKYYNCYDGKIDNNKNSITKIEKAIKDLAQSLISSREKDEKYKETVNLYSKVFLLHASLDYAKDSISDLKVKRKYYKKEIIKYFQNLKHQKIEQLSENIIQIQSKYLGIIEYFLKKLETNLFDLSFNQLVTKKDMFGLNLQHNISFNRVYSDYIIEKTFTEGIIAEDKLSVLLTLLLRQVVKDMILSDFNKKYLLYIPDSLYKKEKKIEKILRMFDDKYARNNIIILITFEDLLKNKAIVKKIRRMDYKFALVFNNESKMEEKDCGILYIANYIFINKKAPNTEKILSYIPEELLENIIYEDITNKVGDLESE